MRVKVPALVLVAVLVLVLLASDGSDADAGPSYDYDPDSRTLTVTSDVPDCASVGDVPWYAHINQMESVVIGDGVRTLGGNAFRGASVLRTVSFPGSLERIGDGCFSGCVWLASADLPGSLTSVGNGAFSGCTRLASVTLRSGFTAGTGVFDDSGSGVSGIDVRVETPDVPAYLFKPSDTHSVLLHDIDLSKAERISEGAFSGADIGSLTVPANISYIGEGAFRGSSVKDVRIEASPEIAVSAFAQCASLTKAEIRSVRDVPESMFDGCSSLSSVSLSDRISSVSANAFRGTAVTELVFPGTMKRVGEQAFASCPQLTHVAFTERLERLGDSAFAGCTALEKAEVQEVSFPGSYVFDGCTALQRVFSASSLELPAGVQGRAMNDGGLGVLVRYDFGDVGGGCTLFSDTVMSSRYIDSGKLSFEKWEDGSGTAVKDVGSLTEDTVLTAVWVQAEGAEGVLPFDAALCVLSAICAAAACAVCFRRL